jgi:hypothetical protein
MQQRRNTMKKHLLHHAKAEDTTDKRMPTAPRHDAYCNDKQTLIETTAKPLLKQCKKIKLQHRMTTYYTKARQLMQQQLNKY